MVTLLSNIQEMLFNLITGLNQWQKNYSEIPDELHKGLLMFIGETAISGGEVPSDLYQILRKLHQPSKEWGIHSLENYYPEEASLVEEFIGITADAEEFMNTYISPHEAQQKNMSELLIYCRDEERRSDKDYRQIRTFLSNPQHSVMSSFQLTQFTESFNDRELIKLIHRCYEEVTGGISNYRKCPHCGWTLEIINQEWCCNKENICKSLRDFEKFELFPLGNERIVRMLPGIQRYVLLPGMSELKIASSLRRKGFTIEMYPNIDEYDLEISNGGKSIFIDVKDFKNPRTLANFFNIKSSTYLEKYRKDVYVVIPQYRNNLYPYYRDRAMALLSEDTLKYIKIIMEKDLHTTLKKVLR